MAMYHFFCADFNQPDIKDGDDDSFDGHSFDEDTVLMIIVMTKILF